MTRNVETIRRLSRVGHNRACAVESLPAIFPGHMAPVVRPEIAARPQMPIAS